VTPRSWEHWITRYEAQGYRVLAPAYPGFEVEVEALNRDPSPVERLTVPAIMAASKSLSSDSRRRRSSWVIRRVARSCSCCSIAATGRLGVAINSAPTEGVRVTPLSQLKSTFPVLKNPANRHRAVPFTYDQWRYVFTNTFDEADARAAYDRYHVPASGGIFWDSVLANFIPGPQDIAVDYHNDARAAPSLHLGERRSPDAARRPTLEREALQVEHDHGDQGISGTLASHAAQQGWEEIADYALAWAKEHATPQPQAAPRTSSA
jgi:hypothetical protein